ncbi:hypothetical protein M1L60_33560 [Actinoplanes sp. TRM 88003]|uniref:Pycsar effector protein domain-containing protein n=1 Tax=Paractinoplanes aksuensis TaxID=2939490 RepID=A0ABT1DXD3_9ACTN|nr:hypothetical protein [Actinoplanes aksuensis]MCO8275523.1 hypothetical protein [Actinoplanes aksuensis]
MRNSAHTQILPAGIAPAPPPWLPEVTLRLLDEALVELGHEENKAARLMAALTVASGAIVTGFFAGRWSPVNLPTVASIVWWLGAAVAVGALGLVGRAATYGDRPDTRVPVPGPLVGADLAILRQWALAVAHNPDEDPVARLWRTRRTIGRKRSLVRWGLIAMPTGLAICLLGGFLPL